MTLSKNFNMNSLKPKVITHTCEFCKGKRKGEPGGLKLHQLISPPNSQPDIKKHDGKWCCNACWRWSKAAYQAALQLAIAQFNKENANKPPQPYKPKAKENQEPTDKNDPKWWNP